MPMSISIHIILYVETYCILHLPNNCFCKSLCFKAPHQHNLQELRRQAEEEEEVRNTIVIVDILGIYSRQCFFISSR